MQYRLNLYYSDYSYDSLAKSLSEKIPKNSKVLFTIVEPDPIFYFIANRKDLKLASLAHTNRDKPEFKHSLFQADYLVANVNDIHLVKMYKEFEEDSLEQFIKQINDAAINKFYLGFLAKNIKEVYQLKEHKNFVLIKL